MKTPILATLAFLATSQAAPLVAKNGFVRFFSTTPMENIEGVSQTAVSTLDLDSGKIAIKARNTSFVFPRPLMQEHFNENYMESDKFPVSAFKGLVTGIDKSALDAGKKISVTVAGDLDVHGVVKHYTTTGFLKKEPDGSVAGETEFHVRIADHDIKVPAIVMAKIADSMDITARFAWRAAETKK
jgi:hypothetical protein